MPTADSDAGPIITLEAAICAAERTVASALNANFATDPVIGPELSRPFSVLGSVVQRHGPLIARVLADALQASGRFEVFTEMAIPIPSVADDLLMSRDSKTDLARIRQHVEVPARRITVDLVAVDRKGGWAGGYDVKRGKGESRRRGPVQRDLLALRLVLASHLANLGFDIDRVDTAVIDYFGASGFNRYIKLSRDELDDHFGIPVSAQVDQMTGALRRAFTRRRCR
jgi:hypothetical protein